MQQLSTSHGYLHPALSSPASAAPASTSAADRVTELLLRLLQQCECCQNFNGSSGHTHGCSSIMLLRAKLHIEGKVQSMMVSRCCSNALPSNPC